jgi:hypothetical protein
VVVDVCVWISVVNFLLVVYSVSIVIIVLGIVDTIVIVILGVSILIVRYAIVVIVEV